MRLHHVQVSCPPGGEDAARRFYGFGLGLPEMAKPEPLQARGGVWFRRTTPEGAVLAELHVGVEDPFVPARRAHPAFLVGPGELARVVERMSEIGAAVDLAERHTLPGFDRVHLADPFGNRVEVLEEAASVGLSGA